MTREALRLLEASQPTSEDYRTVRIRPYDCPESSDRFTADASHLDRFLRRAGR